MINLMSELTLPSAGIDKDDFAIKLEFLFRSVMTFWEKNSGYPDKKTLVDFASCYVYSGTQVLFETRDAVFARLLKREGDEKYIQQWADIVNKHFNNAVDDIEEARATRQLESEIDIINRMIDACVDEMLKHLDEHYAEIQVPGGSNDEPGVEGSNLHINLEE